MLVKVPDSGFIRNVTCTAESYNLQLRDFDFYDKDGFELTAAERKLLEANGFKLNPCLNHWTLHTDWITIPYHKITNLHIDHSMLLHRGDYRDDALEEIKSYFHPGAAFMANSKAKWGLDFAIDHMLNHKDVVEILHIEFDDYDYNRINDKKHELEEWILKQDWEDLAAKIRKERYHWAHLRGPEQNNWKARFLLGWDKAEYTEKSTTFFSQNP